MANDEKPHDGLEPEPPTPPQSGEEILREVGRLKREPAQFRCLGMSCGVLILVLILIGLAWKSFF